VLKHFFQVYYICSWVSEVAVVENVFFFVLSIVYLLWYLHKFISIEHDIHNNITIIMIGLCLNKSCESNV